MRLLISLFILLVVAVLSTSFAPYAEAADDPLTIHFFYSETCPHCRKEQVFLDEIEKKYPDIVVMRYPIHDTSHHDLLSSLISKHHAERYLGVVPLTFIGDDFFVGFDSPEGIGRKIEQSIEKQLDPENRHDNVPNSPDGMTDDTVSIPILGMVNPRDYSLPLIAVVLGFLDGFNVCSLGALVLILGLALALHSRKKTLLFGGLFIAATALVYGLLILLWYQLFSALGSYIEEMQLVIGTMALGACAYFFYEFYRMRKEGPSCSFAGSRMIAVFSKKVNAAFGGGGKLVAVMVTVTVFAAVVTLVEFPCSAAIPVVFAGILADAELPAMVYLLHIALFVLFYMLDEIIVFLIVVFTMKVWLASPKFVTWSTVIEGLLLTGLGLYYLLA